MLNDKSPIADAAKVYGDLFISDGDRERAEETDRCDVCGVTMLSLSERCQQEHDEQQARWARGPITYVVEYGMKTGIRCRVY